MKKSDNPLDIITGIRYYLLEKSIDHIYAPSPNTFHVEEIVDLKRMGFTLEKSNYIVLLMTKKGLETLKAIEIIARALRIPQSNIYYLGLKDKHATTKQYLFIKTNILRKEISEKLYDSRIELQRIGYVKRKPNRKFLLGNRFKIIVCGKNIVNELKEILSEITAHGLPNYYGYQRFGVRRPNSHILGKYIVLKRYDLFVGELLSSIYSYEDRDEILHRCSKIFPGKRFLYENMFNSVLKLFKNNIYKKRLVSLLLEAYLSYLFNELLNTLIESCGWKCLKKTYPMASCRDAHKYYRDVISVENISYSMLKRLTCWRRPGIMVPRDISIYMSNNNTVLEFTLGVGEYASIVLREIFKNKYMLY